MLYQQHMFLSRNKKNIYTFWLKKAPYKSYAGGLQKCCIQTKMFRLYNV